MVSVDRNRWISFTDGREVHRINWDIPSSADWEHIFPKDKRHNIQHKIYQHQRCREIGEGKSKEDCKDEIIVRKKYWELMMNEIVYVVVSKIMLYSKRLCYILKDYAIF